MPAELEQGDATEYKPDITNEDVNEVRVDIAQIDFTGVEVLPP